MKKKIKIQIKSQTKMTGNMKKSIKITNKNQFKKLVELMEQNPDIARGLGKLGSNRAVTRSEWEKYAVILNNLGPPVRTGRQWLKVWIDYKAKIKSKIALSRRDGSSEEIPLTSLQQTVDALLGLHTAIELSEKSLEDSENLEDEKPFSLNPAIKASATSTSTSDDMVLPSIENPSTDSVLTQNSIIEEHSSQTLNFQRLSLRKRAASENRKFDILHNKTEIQAELLKVVKKIEKNTYDAVQVLQKMYNLKEKKLALLEIKEKRKEKESDEKNKLQLQKLELKKRKLDLELKKLSVQNSNI